MIRKAKFKYFNNIKVNDVNDSKRFWKTMKLFFSNAFSFGDKIVIVISNNIIYESVKMVDILLTKNLWHDNTNRSSSKQLII